MNRNTGTRILILLAAAALVSLAGCKDFSFFTELGAKGTISLSPPEITVITGSLVTFSASGGTPPYTFEMASGSGTVDPATGQYEALAQGIDVVMATDSIGQSGTATVTVVNTLEELKISPTSASVSVGNSISFVATGGVGPYTYSIQTNSSGCSIAASTGEYTAGSVTGVSDTIVVTDSDTPPQSCSVPAVVSVSAAVTNVDYSISADSFPAGAMAGESLSGDFTIFNGGSATGTADVSWWLFISADGVFGGAGETLVDNGDEPADIPASGTLVVTPTGSWPADLLPGSYTLFVMLASPDDLNHGNNVYDAGAINLAVPNVDYRVTSVSVTGGYLHVGAAMSGELVLENAGTDDGSEDLTWKVYVSTNTAVDVGDTLIDSGTEGAMTSAEVPRTISF
ncbi:MAG: hypothetical protein JXB06_15145, partial [Spirochaetales bacterium]|nr:hypothetical protein [Spirochaetales bacterium]